MIGTVPDVAERFASEHGTVVVVVVEGWTTPEVPVEIERFATVVVGSLDVVGAALTTFRWFAWAAVGGVTVVTDETLR